MKLQLTKRYERDDVHVEKFQGETLTETGQLLGDPSKHVQSALCRGDGQIGRGRVEQHTDLLGISPVLIDIAPPKIEVPTFQSVRGAVMNRCNRPGHPGREEAVMESYGPNLQSTDYEFESLMIII